MSGTLFSGLSPTAPVYPVVYFFTTLDYRRLDLLSHDFFGSL